MDENKKAIQTRDALQNMFGVKEESQLYYRLRDLHDSTYALTLAETQQEKDKLIEKIKEWYKLCDW